MLPLTEAEKQIRNSADATGTDFLKYTLTALNQLDQGFSVFDHDLKLVSWNDKLTELLQFPPDLAHLGAPFESFVRFNAERGDYGPGSIEEQVAKRIQLARQFRSHCIERTRPDGTVLEIRGHPLPEDHGFVTIYTDITERKRAEALLRESYEQLEKRVEERTLELQNANQQLRAETLAHKTTAAQLKENEQWIRQITDAVPVLIAYIDKKANYQFVNKIHQQWFGADIERWIGRPMMSVVEAHNRDQVQDSIHRVLAGETVVGEYRLKDKHNQFLSVQVSFIPHKADTNEVKGFFFLGTDLTEIKQTQSTLSELQKMQALGQLTGGVAHDFNNLLTIVLGNLSMLELDLEGQNERETLMASLSPAIRAANRGKDLVNSLLTFARKQPLSKNQFDLNELVTDTVQLLGRTLGEQVSLTPMLQDNLPAAESDRSQLANALVNLALNSRDALAQGGEIVVRTRLFQQFQSSSELPAGKYVVVDVSDNGSGMNSETLNRAFEPFYTTKPKGTGTGLGLSMVYGFAKQSDGHVTIKSRWQEGTTISIYLPCVDESPEVQKYSEPGITELPQPKSILVVEDDPDVRSYVERALRQQGYEVQVADSGDQALIQLEKQQFDAVLTDLIMPGHCSGLDLADQVLANNPGTRVMCMTGYAEEQADVPFPLLQKPFQVSELVTTLQKVLSQ